MGRERSGLLTLGKRKKMDRLIPGHTGFVSVPLSKQMLKHVFNKCRVKLNKLS